MWKDEVQGGGSKKRYGAEDKKYRLNEPGVLRDQELIFASLPGPRELVHLSGVAPEAKELQHPAGKSCLPTVTSSDSFLFVSRHASNRIPG